MNTPTTSLTRWTLLLLVSLFAVSCACSMGGGDDGDSSEKPSEKPSAEADEPSAKSDDDDDSNNDDDDKASAKTEDDAPEKKEPSKDAPKVSFDKYKMTVKGDGVTAEGSFFLSSDTSNGKQPLFIKSYFNKFPKGSVISIGDDTKTVENKFSESMDIDVRPFAGSLNLDDVRNKEVVFDMPASIELPDHKKAEFKLPPFKAQYAVAAALSQARDKPVVFKDEPKDANPYDTIAIVKADSSLSNLNIIGGAKTVSEIDFVGVSEQFETDRTRVCKGYSKSPAPVTIKMQDATVAIYDRRTGEVMREGTVKAKDKCPTFVMINKADNTGKHYPSDKELESWFRKELRAVKKMAKENAKAEAAKEETPPTTPPAETTNTEAPPTTPPAAAAATPKTQGSSNKKTTSKKRTTTKKKTPIRIPTTRRIKKFRK